MEFSGGILPFPRQIEGAGRELPGPLAFVLQRPYPGARCAFKASSKLAKALPFLLLFGKSFDEVCRHI